MNCRPSYWIEPKGNWGEGRVELVELPTQDETNDNIVASWVPNEPVEAGKSIPLAYTITASLMPSRLSPGGRVLKTYQTQARALGSKEVAQPGSRRFIIDFSGGDLAYYASDPSLVEVVPTSTNGKITRSFLVPNPHINGFRAAIDVALPPGQTTGPAGLSEIRQSRPDRNLDLSVEGAVTRNGGRRLGHYAPSS